MGRGVSHPAAGWLQKAPTGKSVRHQSSVMVPFVEACPLAPHSLQGLPEVLGNLGKESQVWNRRQQSAPRLSCIHEVWGRQLLLQFRWRLMLHLAIDVITFLPRAYVCSHWRFNRYFSLVNASFVTPLPKIQPSSKTLLYWVPLHFFFSMKGKRCRSQQHTWEAGPPTSPWDPQYDSQVAVLHVELAAPA